MLTWLFYLLIPSAFLVAENFGGSVISLDSNNFDAIINERNFVFTLFCDSSHVCEAVADEFYQASVILRIKGSTVMFARIDGTKDVSLSLKYDVFDYPVLKLFLHGKPVDYTSGNFSDQMVDWIDKKTGPAVKNMQTIEEAKQFIGLNKIAVLGFFPDQTDADALAYISAASSIDDYHFAITSNGDVFTALEASSGEIILYNQLRGSNFIFKGKYTKESIKNFVATEALTDVIEFNYKSAPIVFSDTVVFYLLFFLAKSAAETADIISLAHVVAKDYKSKILFVTIDVENEDHQTILEYIGVHKDDAPTLRIIERKNKLLRYKPKFPKISIESISEFVDGVLCSQHEPYFLSEHLRGQSVTELVSSNFDKVVFDKNKNVLVEFYIPSCELCKEVNLIFEKIAEHFANDSSVLVARIDVSANSLLPHTNFTPFPAVRLFKKGDNDSVDYHGPMLLEDLIKFVESDEFDTGVAIDSTVEEHPTISIRDEL